MTRRYVSASPHNVEVERSVVMGFLTFLSTYLKHPAPAPGSEIAVDKKLLHLFEGCHPNYSNVEEWEMVEEYWKPLPFEFTQGVVYQHSVNALRAVVEASVWVVRSCSVKGLEGGGVEIPIGMQIYWQEGHPLRVDLLCREMKRR